MREKLQILRGYLSKAKSHGFFHILGGNTLVKVISALSVMMFPAIMGKNDFGIFKNADNFYGYMLVVNGLGMANVVLRYCAIFDKPQQKKGYFNFAVRFGLIANIFLIAIYMAIIYIPKLFGYKIIQFDSDKFLAMMLFLAFFDFLFSTIQNFLRTELQNKRFANNSVVFSLLYALIPLGFAFVFQYFEKTIEGAIIGRYIAYAVTLVVVFLSLRKLPVFKVKADHISARDKSSALKYAITALIASGFSTIMPINENVILSNMVIKESYDDFCSAQIVPASVQFLAASVVVFVFPYFARNYLDGKWILQKTRKTVLGMIALMTVIAVLGIIFTPSIMTIFGKEFKTEDSVRLMRIFFITFAINGAIRMPIGNILAAIGEVRFNLYNAIFSCTVHVGICWAMTYFYGIKGAAYGLLIGYIISSIAAIIYLRWYCRRLERRKPRPAA